MSKFFNETLKARNETLPLDGFNLTQEAEPPAASSVPVGIDPGLENSRLKDCREIVVPIAKLVEEQFAGSDSLESAQESYRALRTRLMRLRAERDVRCIVVTSSVQGEGKTHTSINLAQSCAQLHGMRVLLLDADIRTCGLSRALSLPPCPGLGEVLSGQCEIEQAMVATDNPNFYLLSAGSTTLPPAELFAGSRWKEFMGWCKGFFELILVDSPPVLELADVDLIAAACDGVLMVVRAHHTKRELLHKSAAQLNPKKFLGLVYNAVENGLHNRYPYRTYKAGLRS
jgi:capsular exopolysaccharide synthesis family protein